jgi:Cu(I)/Ag(I) efflux system membrane fusion protein
VSFVRFRAPLVEITSEVVGTKKIVITGPMPLSEYIFRKGSDPMAGMKM